MSGAVSAEVRYLGEQWKGRGQAPSIGDRASRRANTEKREVTIHDAREMAAAELHLDVAGFMLARHPAAALDFQDPRAVREGYYPQVQEVLKRLTGAEAVFITQHVVRTEDTSDFNTAYARFIHCDYSIANPVRSGNQALAKHGAGLDPSRRWEFAWYNTWQPIHHEARRNPLAVMDARSVDATDVLDYFYTGYIKNSARSHSTERNFNQGASSMPIFNAAQRLCYFPAMQPHEMLVFKQLDSRPGRALACPHTSFDIEAPAEAPPRRSIEVRAVCAFGQ